MPPILCFPDGLLKVNVISGTPVTFAVNAMEPFANAASGRPDGASVTERVSITSAYISFDVCRTFARRQGNAGVFGAGKAGVFVFEKFEPRGVLLSMNLLVHNSS